MNELPIDINEALRIAQAATQQHWHVDRSGTCGDLAIADLDEFEVCASQSPLFEARSDAEADAHHIATFDPPTVQALLRRLQLLEEGLELHVDLVLFLLRVARLGPLDDLELIHEAPSDEAKAALHVLMEMALPLIT